MKKYTFKQAVPVWEKNKDKTMNYNLVFRSVVSKYDKAVVALTASSMYQMFVNGELVAEGPARAGHGYYRVDEIDISEYLTKDNNVVAVYVDGYYVENFYLIKQPSFFCAEIIADGNVIAATGNGGFEAKYHSDRIRKIVRYSYQRTFAEAYRYGNDYKDFECELNPEFTPVELVKTEDKKFIERGVPYPSYKRCDAQSIVLRGTVDFQNEPIEPNRTRYIDLVPYCAGFDLHELELINTDEVDKGIYTVTAHNEEKAENSFIGSNEYALYRLYCEKTGFVRIDVETEKETELIVTFDEILIDGDVSTKRMPAMQGTVVWFLQPGKYSLIGNEPYSMKYIKVINKSDGCIKVKNVGITEFAFDIDVPRFVCGNPKIGRIYDAAVETFKQNTIDIYMDCPSRERAGWLCDSFFTSRVERFLTGKSDVERNFLENFIIAEGFDDIDKRLFAMCYPSDFLSRNFIPNWCMWYVYELEEYIERTGDKEFAECVRDKILGLVGYFEEYENEDGLLERLDGWVFVEHRTANCFTQDVSYPTNMMYAKMLRTVDRIYNTDYSQKAERIEKNIRDNSYFDGFFHDHAVRQEDGSLKVIADDITETCQYYAFYSGVAAKEDYSELWDRLVNEFGPARATEDKWPGIHPSNAFIGYYLRLEILNNENENEKLLESIIHYFDGMAEKTGTLWEMGTEDESCNHGFASYVMILIDKLFN